MTKIPKDLSAAIEHLETAGGKLANIAFNLSQQPGNMLHPKTAKIMRQCQVEWDAALSGLHAKWPTQKIKEF